MAESKVFTICRDRDELGFPQGPVYTVSRRRVRLGRNGLWNEVGAKGREPITMFCPAPFERMTGVRLAPGTKAKFRLVKVED